MEEKLDVKLDKKAAKKLAEENLLKSIRKDTLSREAALDQITLNKIRDKWRNTLIDVKVPEMQDNLKHILHYMEKLIEADNYRKMLFEDEREELNEKNVLQAQSHRSALDVLYGIYQGRVHDLHEAYRQNVLVKKTDAAEEFNTIEEREGVIQENMQAMLYQMTQNRDVQEDTMNCNMFLKLDHERSKNTEKYESLQLKLEKKIERRWGEIKTTLTNYDEATKARRKDYIQLKVKDDADSRIIRQQLKKTQKLFEQLDELKNCLDNCYAPKEKLTVIKDLRDERTAFFDAFKLLKLILADELKQDEKNIKMLTVSTNDTISDLQKICKEGEQILTLFRVCLKFETEFEKVLPVGTGLSLVKAGFEMGKGKMRGKIEENITSHKEISLITDCAALSKFWKRVGKIHLSIMALKKCLEHLNQENSFLKSSLTSYLKNSFKKSKK